MFNQPTDRFSKFLPPKQYRNQVQPMPGGMGGPNLPGGPQPGGLQPGPSQPPTFHPQPVNSPGPVNPPPGVGMIQNPRMQPQGQPQGQMAPPNQEHQFMQMAMKEGIPQEVIAQFLAQKMGR